MNVINNVKTLRFIKKPTKQTSSFLILIELTNFLLAYG